MSEELESGFVCPWCREKLYVREAAGKITVGQVIVRKTKGLTFGDGVRFGLGLMFSVWLAGMGIVSLWTLISGYTLSDLI